MTDIIPQKEWKKKVTEKRVRNVMLRNDKLEYREFYEIKNQDGSYRGSLTLDDIKDKDGYQKVLLSNITEIPPDKRDKTLLSRHSTVKLSKDMIEYKVNDVCKCIKNVKIKEYKVVEKEVGKDDSKYIVQFNGHRARKKVNNPPECLIDITDDDHPKNCKLCRAQKNPDFKNRVITKFEGINEWVTVYQYKSLNKDGHIMFWLSKRDNFEPVEWPQKIKADHIEDILNFMKGKENWIVFFNGRGAANTENHLHFQGIQYSGEKPLPVLKAIEEGREYICTLDGVSIGYLKEYPTTVILFEGSGDDIGTLSGVIFKVAGAFEENRQDRVPINILFTKSDILLFPRDKELPSQFSASELRFGTMEMAGKFIVTTNDEYEAIKKAIKSSTLEKALKEASLDIKRSKEIIKSLLPQEEQHRDTIEKRVRHSR